jgi:hypothetical protein
MDAGEGSLVVGSLRPTSSDLPLVGGGGVDDATNDSPGSDDGEENDEDSFTVVEILGADGGGDRGGAWHPAAVRPDRSSISNTVLARRGILLADGGDSDQAQEERLVRRRRELVRELLTVERSSFRLFAILGFVPAVFLLVSIVLVTTDRVDCSLLPAASVASSSASSSLSPDTKAETAAPSSDAGNGIMFACWNEPRTLRNAFTTRCICDSLSTHPVERTGAKDGTEGREGGGGQIRR